MKMILAGYSSNNGKNGKKIHISIKTKVLHEVDLHPVYNIYSNLVVNKWLALSVAEHVQTKAKFHHQFRFTNTFKCFELQHPQKLRSPFYF